MSKEKEVNFNDSQYYRVFLFDPEVLENTGDTFIPRFEHNPEGAAKDKIHAHLRPAPKNLAIITKATIENLSERIHRYSSEGAEYALRAIAQLQNKKITQSDGVTYYNASTTLDIALVEDRHAKSGQDSVVDILEHFITSPSYKPVIKHSGFAIVSDDLAVHGLLGDRGVEIEEARTLKINRDIVHRGIVEGNNDLLAKLMEQSEGYRIGGDIARDLLHAEALYPNQFISFEQISNGSGNTRRLKQVAKVLPNSLDVMLLTMGNGLPIQVPIYAEHERRNIELPLTINKHRYHDGVQGLWPRFFEQYVLLQHMLLDESIRIVFIAGAAGTGKTLLAYATALDLTLASDNPSTQNNKLMGDKTRSSLYSEIVPIKSNWANNELGFMPGDLQAKMAGNLESFQDAHDETILGQKIPYSMLLEDPRATTITTGGKPDANVLIRAFKSLGYVHPGNHPIIHLPNLSHMRGRSLSNKFVIIDEAQNFKPFDLKTFLSRASNGCKYVVLGDLDQFDNYPTCTPEKNGFTAAIQAFLPQSFSSLVYLGTSQRDAIAIVANDMKTTFGNSAAYSRRR